MLLRCWVESTSTDWAEAWPPRCRDRGRQNQFAGDAKPKYLIRGRRKGTWGKHPLCPLQWLRARTFLSAQFHHCSAFSQRSLFIFGHTHSSIYIILCTNNRSFLPVCFPLSLESTHSFSINHALISPVLIHPVLRVAFLPLVPSTLIIHHPFTLSFKAKKLFCNPSHCSLPFLLQE